MSAPGELPPPLSDISNASTDRRPAFLDMKPEDLPAKLRHKAKRWNSSKNSHMMATAYPTPEPSSQMDIASSPASTGKALSSEATFEQNPGFSSNIPSSPPRPAPTSALTSKNSPLKNIASTSTGKSTKSQSAVYELNAVLKPNEKLIVGRKPECYKTERNEKATPVPIAVPSRVFHSSRVHACVALARHDDDDDESKGSTGQVTLQVFGRNGCFLDDGMVSYNEVRTWIVQHRDQFSLNLHGCVLTVEIEGLERLCKRQKSIVTSEDNVKANNVVPAPHYSSPLSEPVSYKSSTNEDAEQAPDVPYPPSPCPALASKDKDNPLSQLNESQISDLLNNSDDLEAFYGHIASFIVFNSRTTLYTSEIHANLAENHRRSLRYEELASVLFRGPFGYVDSHGVKDADGRQVETSWYYIPDKDINDERRLTLQPFVKKVRTSQTTAKQYYFKKPAMKRRRL